MYPAVAAAFMMMLGQVSSEPGDAFQSFVDAGLRLYKEQRFAEAAVEFEAAYALQPEPALMYNVARCFEQIPNPKRAVAKYEEFLLLAGTSAERRAKARRALEALQEELSSKPARAAPPAPSDSVLPAGGALSPGKPAPAPVASASSRRSYMAEAMLFGVGGVGLAVGTTFAILAQKKADEVSLAVTRETQRDVEDGARTRALVADIAFATAAAATGVGLYVLLTGANSESAVSLAPTITTGGAAGLVVGGRL